ncbi:hypothetical protein K0M31_019865 [Melipona bicolor]|uniref:Uncharacterized protein n=1 Tax=Melipona bicolor TaxID=60889 RepID=A0AA40KQ64_9HYME|nr:hypothetical protein K0M31_019865 [Melipona bicolor]
MARAKKEATRMVFRLGTIQVTLRASDAREGGEAEKEEEQEQEEEQQQQEEERTDQDEEGRVRGRRNRQTEAVDRRNGVKEVGLSLVLGSLRVTTLERRVAS